MKKIVSIALALLVMASSLGFSLNTHYCGGEAVESTISIAGFNNPNCGMVTMNAKCGIQPENSLQATPCCENHHQILKLDDNSMVFSNLDVNPVFFIAFVSVVLEPFTTSESDSNSWIAHSPPIPDKDIQVLHQTFII